MHVVYECIYHNRKHPTRKTLFFAGYFTNTLNFILQLYSFILSLSKFLYISVSMFEYLNTSMIKYVLPHELLAHQV